MLHVWLGNFKQKGVSLTKPDTHFNRYFELKNISTDFSKRLIESCADGAKLISEGVFMHPDWGMHGVTELPSGIKTTLLAKYNKEVITNMVFCGNNCIPFIVEASRDEDVTVSTMRYIYWYESGLIDDVDKVHIMNDDSYVINSWDYLLKHNEFSKKEIII